MTELLVYPTFAVYASNFLGDSPRLPIISLGDESLSYILGSLLLPPPVLCRLPCMSPTSVILTATSDHDMPFQWLSVA